MGVGGREGGEECGVWGCGGGSYLQSVTFVDLRIDSVS